MNKENGEGSELQGGSGSQAIYKGIGSSGWEELYEYYNESTKAA